MANLTRLCRNYYRILPNQVKLAITEVNLTKFYLTNPIEPKAGHRE